MTVLLLANVGNRDVWLSDPSLLPESLQSRPLPARKLGAELIANFDRYAAAIQLPLIGVALRWLLEHEGVSPDALYVHLFASDQAAPPITPQNEWLKDTIRCAEVVQRLLMNSGLEWTAQVERDGKRHKERQHLRLPKRQVHVHTIPGNPADYKNVLDYFDRELPRLAQRIGADDKVYLEVSGGTPAMTSMLIAAGVDAFGQRAHTLYVEPYTDQPYRVGIGRRFFSRRARVTLHAQLELHAYVTAAATLDREKDLITPNSDLQALLAALLDYAGRRLAFDFDRACDALQRACQYATGDTQSRVQYWQRELRSRDSAALLAELIHSSRIKYQLGDYADLTQRLFRFQEACLRYLAEQMGMRYKDEKNDEYVDQAWVDRVPGLRPFLENYKHYGRVRIADSLNRISLGAIVDFFVKNDPAWASRQQIVCAIHCLSKVAELRNKGLAGHGFQGISKEDLSQAFGKDADEIIPHLEKIYVGLFERSIGPSPYAAVNELIIKLLAL